MNSPPRANRAEVLPRAAAPHPVECLGRTFASDDERRVHFLKQLRARLQHPDFRGTEGFPQGSDEDILRLSDPPYYTACPNPFLADWLRCHGPPVRPRGSGTRTPYSGDLQSSTRHPVYTFHPYHTKVPPEVIRTLIEHYTDPGDVVLDGFGGSGMTGVAAREAGRHAIVGDLSTVAGFIAGVNCRAHAWQEALALLGEVCAASERVWGRLYRTADAGRPLAVNYYVWSDVFTCPECVGAFPFFPHGVIHHGTRVETRAAFPCPFCGAELNVRRVERVLTGAGKKKTLVWVNAGTGGDRVNRAPNPGDLALAAEVETLPIPTWYPVAAINPHGYSAHLAQLGDKAITDVSRFLSRRNLLVFADLWERTGQLADTALRNLCRATLTSIFTVVSERQGYFGGGGGMSGNLYLPIVRMEKNVHATLRRKLGKLADAERAKAGLRTQVLVTTQSTTALPALPDASIDYVYTDPPFGANIIYSEMNALLESWLRVKTDAVPEAVIDASRQRHFEEYGGLLRRCFAEYHRLLKPGRWLTVEFHNTSARVWNLIQNAIGASGFVVAQVGVLDKGSTTILADIRPGAARYDLLIAAYKPEAALEQTFRLQAGSAEGTWEFLRRHLAHLPCFLRGPHGTGEVIAERTPHLLFDRMVAFHVQRNATVPLSAAECHAGLRQRFPEHDGMHFLPEQEAEYRRQRLTVRELAQPRVPIGDEVSAVQWLRRELARKPQTYQELHPGFTRATAGWPVHETPLDLRRLLEENFLVNEGRGRWYVPDPRQAQDRERLRERTLLREFEEYERGGGRLERFRLEAVRAGFRRAWQERRYRTIREVARKLPEEVLQGDAQLLMWYDQALTRLGEEE